MSKKEDQLNYNYLKNRIENLDQRVSYILFIIKAFTLVCVTLTFLSFAISFIAKLLN